MLLTITRLFRATTYHMTYQLLQLAQLAGDITPGLSEESCRMIQRWISTPSTPATPSGSHSISHENLESPRSTTSEALSLARELMALPTVWEPNTPDPAVRDYFRNPGRREVRFMTHGLLVSVDQSIASYESGREDDRLLSDVLGMGGIRIVCMENVGSTIVFVDDHLISRAEARALLELAQ